MKQAITLGWAVACWASLGMSVASADVVRHPVNAGMSLEQFQLFSPISYQSGKYAPVFMVRPTGWVFGSATVDERTDLVFGLGATVFSITHGAGTYPAGYENELYPAVSMVQATGSYTWGDLKNPALKVTVGAMPYKYNPDAKDLGEYLFRSTPYPNTVLNSPFDVVNVAHMDILGGILSKNFASGKWKNDVLLTSSNTHIPLGDLGLAYVTSYRINPVVELGAGINLFRLIPIQPELTTYKKDPANAYFTYSNGKKYSTVRGYYSGADSAIAASVYDSLTTGGALPSGVSGLDYYSLKGQMLMARFSIDFKPILGNNIDMKLYGEWAMLGVQNYPVFYEKPLDRMPMMLGLNLPTWGLLDMLNVEGEYWKNPYLNSDYDLAYPQSGTGIGTPYLGQDPYQNLGLSSFRDAVDGDDFKWSISATKSFAKALSITAKASKDHMQVMQLWTSHLSRSYGDVMSQKDSWYYAIRVQVAI